MAGLAEPHTESSFATPCTHMSGTPVTTHLPPVHLLLQLIPPCTQPLLLTQYALAVLICNRLHVTLGR